MLSYYIGDTLSLLKHALNNKQWFRSGNGAILLVDVRLGDDVE